MTPSTTTTARSEGSNGTERHSTNIASLKKHKQNKKESFPPPASSSGGAGAPSSSAMVPGDDGPGDDFALNLERARAFLIRQAIMDWSGETTTCIISPAGLYEIRISWILELPNLYKIAGLESFFSSAKTMIPSTTTTTTCCVGGEKLSRIRAVQGEIREILEILLTTSILCEQIHPKDSLSHRRQFTGATVQLLRWSRKLVNKNPFLHYFPFLLLRLMLRYKSSTQKLIRVLLLPPAVLHEALRPASSHLPPQPLLDEPRRPLQFSPLARTTHVGLVSSPRRGPRYTPPATPANSDSAVTK